MQFLSLPPLLLLLATSAESAAFDSGGPRQHKIGGIFKSDGRRSSSFAAFNFAFNPLMRNGWFGRLGIRHQYEHAIEFVEDPEDSFQMSSAICRLISRGVIAIFGPMHYKTMPMVLSITDYFEITYITTSFVDKLPPDRTLQHSRSSRDDGAQKFQGRYIVRLRPVMTPAVIELIDHEKWERFFFLYDSKSALLRLREIFEAYKNKDSTISADIRDLTDAGPDAAATVLRYINDKSKETLKRVFLDLADRKMQQKIFEEIKAIRGNRLDYHYLIMGSDMNEVNQTMFMHGGVNITGFTVLNFSDPTFTRFKDEFWFSQERVETYKTDLDIIDASHRILPLSVALMIDGFEAFFRAHQQTRAAPQIPRDTREACALPETPAFPAENLTAAIKGEEAAFAGISGRVQFDRVGYRENYRVQGLEAGVRSELQLISVWTNEGFRLTRNHSKTRSNGFRLPFSNRTRIVTSILGEPFLMIRHNRTLDGTPLVGNDRFEGFCADLIKLLATEIGFDYVIKPVADGRYGDDSVNQTWNGMIGELYRHEADIAVAPLTIASKREKVVDFSTPYMEVGLSIMFLKPASPVSDRFGFMKPLSMEIWMCIAFAYLGVSVVLFVVSRFSPYEWHLNSESDKADKVTNDFSIFNSLWFTLSAFMQQGGDISPRSLSGRIVGSVWWFFTLIIVSSYTANLAAFLTVERMSTPIQSYEDLAKQTKIKYGVLNSGSSKEFFRNSTVQDFRRMWQFMDSNPSMFVNTVKEGVDRVLNSNNDYAFLLESTMNEYYSQDNCRTIKVGSNLDSGRGYGIATPSGSDLREIINLKVLQFKERGEITRLKSTWWDSSKCQDQKEDAKKSSAQSLELRSVVGLFYILIVGTVLGILLSIMEFVYRCALLAKRKKRKFREVLREMLILSTRGRIVLDCSTENADLIDNGGSRRFLK